MHLHYGRVDPRAGGFNLPVRARISIHRDRRQAGGADDTAAALAAIEPHFHHYHLLGGRSREISPARSRRRADRLAPTGPQVDQARRAVFRRNGSPPLLPRWAISVRCARGFA